MQAAQGDLAGFALPPVARSAVEADRRQARVILSFALLMAGLVAGFILSLGQAEPDPAFARSLLHILN